MKSISLSETKMSELLAEIGQRSLNKLRRIGAPKMIADPNGWELFHEFRKKKIFSEIVEEVLNQWLILEPIEVQVELVEALSSERKHHRHDRTHAFVRVLGVGEHLLPAEKAWGYLEPLVAWLYIYSDEEFDIPPGTPHGFAREDGGSLFFLSVQSPPIDQPGNEDYVDTSSWIDERV